MSDMMNDALRAQVVGLQLARRQSNDVVNKLVSTKMDAEGRKELFDLVVKHCMEQETARSAQLEAVIRTAAMQLNTIAQTTADQGSRHQLVEVIKALTLTVECAGFQVANKKEDDATD